MAALKLDYAVYVKLNGGDFCGVCGRKPSATRRLDRDHDHRTKEPRGLCCSRCNRALPVWVTVEWLEAAIRYLKRAERRGRA